MKILFVSPEVVPFAKTGGLADVAGSLPKALKILGEDIRVLMPRYKSVSKKKYALKTIIKKIEIPIGENLEKVDIMEGKIPGSKVTVYFVDNDKYFGSRTELYQVEGKDYPDNLERFTLFCRAGIEMLKKLNWAPDIVHANDWQSALMMAYIKNWFKDDPFFKSTATVYSVHNLGYLGMFNREKLPITGLGWDQFIPEKMEFWGNIALTKAGFVYADVINTVSETYAKEVQTEAFGFGLDGLLRFRASDLYGILNGIDYEVWNPATDPNLVNHYTQMTMDEKTENKLALQDEFDLPEKKRTPLIALIGRLTVQKGFDILAAALEQVMKLNCQLVILGNGEPKYHDLLKKMHKAYPKHIGIKLGFDEALAARIYSGSDLFLMPSRYEPCGLGQLISFRYGTIPIVRKTGGLADTVHEFNSKTGEGDGFVFEGVEPAALLATIKRAIEAYKKPSVWGKLQEKVMQYDFSWDVSAKKYQELYQKATAKLP
jgi:starch synthase